MQWSCIKENRDNCFIPQFLRVITDDSVAHFTVYVFDENNRFIDSIGIGKPDSVTQGEWSETVSLAGYTPAHRRITAVVWGNGAGFSPIVQGTSIDDSFLSLTMLDASQSIAMSPPDIHYASAEINLVATQSITHEVTLERVVARARIRTFGLTGVLGATGGNFSYRIGTTPNSINFRGELFGDQVSYSPPSQFAGDILSTQNFTTLPSDGRVVTVSNYSGTQLIFSTNMNVSGDPLILVPDRLLDIIIRITGAGISVTVTLKPWNTSDIDQVFP